MQQWEQNARTSLRHRRWDLTERANRVLPGREHVVSGDLAQVLVRDKVVVLAEWSRGSRLRTDASRSAGAWAEAGFGVLVVAARNPWSRLRPEPLPQGVALVRRPNLAYDFGSWQHALTTWPEIAGKDLVVLTNDSLVGPLGPLDELLRRNRLSRADVWAATANRHPRPHLQSYLLAFRGGVLASEPLRGFFAEVQPLGSKRELVQAYELGLTRLVDAHGLRREVGWAQDDLGLHPSLDLSLDGWRQLLDAGFPFVKRSLLTHPGYAYLRPAVEQVVSVRAADHL